MPQLNLTLTDNLANWLDSFLFAQIFQPPFALPTFGLDTNQRNWNDGFSFRLSPSVLNVGTESLNNWQDGFAFQLLTPVLSDKLTMSDRLGLGRGYAFSDDNGGNWLDDISYLLGPNSLLVGAQRLIQRDKVVIGYGLVGLSDTMLPQIDGFGLELGTIFGPWPNQSALEFQLDAIFWGDSFALGLWVPQVEALTDTLTLSDSVQTLFGFGLNFVDDNETNWNDATIVSSELSLAFADNLNHWADKFRTFWFSFPDTLNNWQDGVSLAFPLPMVSTPTLAFQASAGATPPSQLVTVSNFYSGSFVFSATADVPWLQVTPVSGTAPQDIEVAVNSTGLAVGTYTGHVYVYGSGPAIITVTFTIGAGDIVVQTGGTTVGVISASGSGETSFLDVLYRYANLTLPYNPQDPGLSYTYDNSSLADTVALYARFFNLLNEPSTPLILNAGTTAVTTSGILSLSGLFGCLDVRLFGAIGDGVADDTAAVQRALDKAHQNYQALIATGATAASAGVPLSISGSQLYPDSIGIAGPLGSTVVCIPSGVYCRVYPRIFDFRNINVSGGNFTGQPPPGTNSFPSDPTGLVALLIDDGVTLQVDGGLILGYDQGVLEQQATLNAQLGGPFTVGNPPPVGTNIVQLNKQTTVATTGAATVSMPVAANQVAIMLGTCFMAYGCEDTLNVMTAATFFEELIPDVNGNHMSAGLRSATTRSFAGADTWTVQPTQFDLGTSIVMLLYDGVNLGTFPGFSPSPIIDDQFRTTGQGGGATNLVAGTGFTQEEAYNYTERLTGSPISVCVQSMIAGAAGSYPITFGGGLTGIGVGNITTASYGDLIILIGCLNTSTGKWCVCGYSFPPASLPPAPPPPPPAPASLLGGQEQSGVSTMWILENKYAFTGGPFGPNPGPSPTTFLNATTNWESGPRNTGIRVTGEGFFDCGGAVNATEFQTGGWLNELRGGAIRFCKCDNSQIDGVTIQDFVSNQGIYWGHSIKCNTFNVLFHHSYGGSVFNNFGPECLVPAFMTPSTPAVYPRVFGPSSQAAEEVSLGINQPSAMYNGTHSFHIAGQPGPCVIILPIGSVGASDPPQSRCANLDPIDFTCDGIFPTWTSVVDSMGNNYTQLAGPEVNTQACNKINCPASPPVYPQWTRVTWALWYCYFPHGTPSNYTITVTWNTNFASIAPPQCIEVGSDNPIVVTNVTGLANFTYAKLDASDGSIPTPTLTTTQPTVVLMFGQLPRQGVQSGDSIYEWIPLPNSSNGTTGWTLFYLTGGFSNTIGLVQQNLPSAYPTDPVGYVSPPGTYGGGAWGMAPEFLDAICSDRDTASIAMLSLFAATSAAVPAVVTNAGIKADLTFFALVYDVMRESTAYSNRFLDVNAAIGDFSNFHTDFHDNIANECGLPPYGTHFATDNSLLFNWTYSEELNVDGNRYGNAYTKNRDQVWQPSMWITQSASQRTMTPTNYMVGNDIWMAFPKGQSVFPSPPLGGNVVGPPYPYYAGVTGNTEPNWAAPAGTLAQSPTLGAGSGPWPYVLDSPVAVSGALVGFWSQGQPNGAGPYFALPTSDPAYGNDLGDTNYTSTVGSVTVFLNGNPLVQGVDWNPGKNGANLPDFIQFSPTFIANQYDVITVNMLSQVLWVDLGAANITCPQVSPCFLILGGCGNNLLMGGYRMLDNQVSDNYMDGIGFAGLDHGQISHSTVLRNSGNGIVDLSLTNYNGLQSNGMSIINNNSADNTCANLLLDMNEPGAPNYDNPEVVVTITRGGTTQGFFTAVNNEVPIGAINGGNTVFQLAHIPAAGSLIVYADGLRTQAFILAEGLVATITFTTPPSTSVVVDYEY